MDEVNVRIQPQSSVCSDSNADENSGNDVISKSHNRRICLIGTLANNVEVRTVAASFAVPIVSSETGREFIEDDTYSTMFVLEPFEGDVYNYLFKQKQTLLGPIALKQLAAKNESLPDNTRPLFNLAMTGVITCFTGFRRSKNDLVTLLPLIHHMGGSIRKTMSHKVTHLIANVCSGEKYQYANTFKVPVMNPQWVYASWEKRHDLNFTATLDKFVAEYKLKPFHGAKVCFVGFTEDEEKHMTDVLISNGGSASAVDDPGCTHIVKEHTEVYTFEAASAPLTPTIPPESATPPNFDPPLDSSSYSTFLETLNEKPNDDESETNSSLILNNTTDNNRKRKNSSTDDLDPRSKRRKDKCASEKKIKVSGIFKTPISYFSNRRRTIDNSTFSRQLNHSVLSSSGLFNVETLENLSIYDDNGASTTPLSTSKKIGKKNVFARTFSSSKFSKRKSKKRDLNGTRLSFNDHSVIDGLEQLNESCFSQISPNPHPQCELRSGSSKDARGPVSTVSVVDASVCEKPETPSKAHVVKAEWFWTSVQKETCLDEKDYLYDECVDQVFSPNARRDSHQATPGSATRRKRKRFHETLLSSLTHQQSPGLHKRRSSVSDAGLLSVSGSFIDGSSTPEKGVVDGTELTIETPRKGLTARQQVFLELVQTESNYVEILTTIMIMFKKHLEDMPEEEALLNNIELNLIFGKIPPIYETHVKMLEDFQIIGSRWGEDRSIGQVILKYSKDLLKAYPPYINYFEEMKEVLTQCDQTKLRFHAFLKACQTKPECGRQSLQELMIRPVQRLGSICLLLDSILKHTPKTSADHIELERALAALKEVMNHINEDKRKAEAQVTIFTIFNEIDNCPPEIISSHRNFIAKADVIQVSTTEGLSSKGTSLVLFLFSDTVEVCKRKSKMNTKSPGTTGSLQRPMVKPYKHVRLLPLNTIRKVIDIKETEQSQKVFCFVCRNNDEVKEKVFTFTMADDEADKTSFLKIFVKQMANNTCTPDADKYLAYLEPHQLDIDTSDVSNGTLSKAFKFASRTRLKVGRAFSFNKTPSKLKRAVSSMMSPFGSSNNITPSSELAQMRLASYSNLVELGNDDGDDDDESPPVAPMSVQPTRKMKPSKVNTFKRL